MTAAHCGSDKERNLTRVRLGEWNYETDQDCQQRGVTKICLDTPQDIAIEDFVAHSEYDEQKRLNDIALIRLSQAAHMTKYVRPICLPLSQDLQGITDYEGIQFTVAGWGATENSSRSYTKLKVDLKGNEKCVWEKKICAGGEAGKDSCWGDSGNALMASHASAEGSRYWYAAGVVSYGMNGCGKENVPGVYTRVASYIEWIREAVGEGPTAT